MATDFIRTWAAFQRDLIERRGVYPATIHGRTAALLTFGEAKGIYKFWEKVGTNLGALDATNALMNSWISWNNWMIDTYAMRETDQRSGYLGKYMFLPATDRFLRIISDYVVKLSTYQWAQENIESAFERALWAWYSSATPGAILGTLMDAARKTKDTTQQILDAGGNGLDNLADALSATSDIIKYLTLAAAGFGLYWVIK